MWWMDSEPYPGPDFEDDFNLEYKFGVTEPFRFPKRDNEVLFTLPAGFRPASIQPGDMYTEDGKPVGIVRQVDFNMSGQTSVIVQVSTY